MKHTDRDLIPNTPRNIRLDAGMSASAVAALMGISAPSMSRFERQHTNPTASTLAAFYAACGREDLVSYMLPMIGASAVSVVLSITEERTKIYGAGVVGQA